MHKWKIDTSQFSVDDYKTKMATLAKASHEENNARNELAPYIYACGFAIYRLQHAEVGKIINEDDYQPAHFSYGLDRIDPPFLGYNVDFYKIKPGKNVYSSKDNVGVAFGGEYLIKFVNSPDRLESEIDAAYQKYVAKNNEINKHEIETAELEQLHRLLYKYGVPAKFK